MDSDNAVDDGAIGSVMDGADQDDAPEVPRTMTAEEAARIFSEGTSMQQAVRGPVYMDLGTGVVPLWCRRQSVKEQRQVANDLEERSKSDKRYDNYVINAMVFTRRALTESGAVMFGPGYDDKAATWDPAEVKRVCDEFNRLCRTNLSADDLGK